MTAETVGAGWLLVGVVLIAAGFALVRVACSEWSERRANRAERRARQATIVRVSRAAVVSPRDADGLDDLWLELLATPRIPTQRDGSAS